MLTYLIPKNCQIVKHECPIYHEKDYLLQNLYSLDLEMKIVEVTVNSISLTEDGEIIKYSVCPRCETKFIRKLGEKINV